MGGASLAGIAMVILRPLRWVLLAVLAAVALEVVTMTTLERLNVTPPAAQRRAECTDCTKYLGIVEAALNVAVHAQAEEHARGLPLDDVRALAAHPTSHLDEAKRRALGKQVMNGACKGVTTHKPCIMALQRHKARALATIMSSDPLFALAMQRAALSVLAALNESEALPDVSAALEAQAAEHRLGGLCAATCAPQTLVDYLMPPSAFADPRIQPFLVVLADLWGTALLVLVVGGLLVATLHVRSTAAQRQHGLYLRLVDQFKHRVTPAQPRIPPGPSPAGTRAGAAPANHGKTVSKGT